MLGSLVEMKQVGSLKPRVWWALGAGLIVAAAIGFGVLRLETHGHDNAGRLPGSPCEVEPKVTELLCEVGDLALFAGETEADVTRNAVARKADSECPEIRNSLFLRQKTKEGTNVWRLVMTSGGGWQDADGMSEWCRDCASGVRACFFVIKARMSADGRGIWLVCDPHTSTYWALCGGGLRIV